MMRRCVQCKTAVVLAATVCGFVFSDQLIAQVVGQAGGTAQVGAQANPALPAPAPIGGQIGGQATGAAQLPGQIGGQVGGQVTGGAQVRGQLAPGQVGGQATGTGQVGGQVGTPPGLAPVTPGLRPTAPLGSGLNQVVPGQIGTDLGGSNVTGQTNAAVRGNMNLDNRWRYRLQNGRWWYWLGERGNGRWAYRDGNRWNDYTRGVYLDSDTQVSTGSQHSTGYRGTAGMDLQYDGPYYFDRDGRRYLRSEGGQFQGDTNWNSQFWTDEFGTRYRSFPSVQGGVGAGIRIDGGVQGNADAAGQINAQPGAQINAQPGAQINAQPGGQINTGTRSSGEAGVRPNPDNRN